ncbi:MAG: hypothetical protein ORN53_00340 [Crocinitomicaceae bacterium]|nr:hypothetical protein [Crocinitomicaceae bacterium]
MKCLGFTFLLILMVSACQNPEPKTIADQKNHQDEKVAVSSEFEEKVAADLERSDSEQNTLGPEEMDSIQELIELFKKVDIEGISNKISYPLDRDYPIPSIRNKEEFIKRFHEVFDQKLIDNIAQSDIGQWTEVGWRGIMLDNSVVWMSFQRGFISAINYQSKREKNIQAELIRKDKEQLHATLRNFKSPVYKIQTEKFLIRIDELSENSYRYVSWRAGVNEAILPDLVLKNGLCEMQGSGGNHEFTFVNGIYTYKVRRNILGERDSPDVTIQVEKRGEIIFIAPGSLILD